MFLLFVVRSRTFSVHGCCSWDMRCFYSYWWLWCGRWDKGVEEGKKKGKGGRENCVYFIKIPASYKHRLMLNVIMIEKLLYSMINIGICWVQGSVLIKCGVCGLNENRREKNNQLKWGGVNGRKQKSSNKEFYEKRIWHWRRGRWNKSWITREVKFMRGAGLAILFTDFRNYRNRKIYGFISKRHLLKNLYATRRSKTARRGKISR